MALSDTWLKSNNGKVRDATQVINDRDGLSVRISPKGKIVFQMRYRFNNASKRMDIGTYPMMSLKEARAEVKDVMTVPIVRIYLRVNIKNAQVMKRELRHESFSRKAVNTN